MCNLINKKLYLQNILLFESFVQNPTLDYNKTNILKVLLKYCPNGFY